MNGRRAVQFAILSLLVCGLAQTGQASVKHIYVHAGGLGGPAPGALDGHIVRMDASGGSLTTIMPAGAIPDHRPRGLASVCGRAPQRSHSSRC